MVLRKPRRQWSGLERQLLNKLFNSLKSIEARDSRMATRAGQIGSTPYLFAQNEQDPVYLAMYTLYDRIQECLAAKTQS